MADPYGAGMDLIGGNRYRCRNCGLEVATNTPPIFHRCRSGSQQAVETQPQLILRLARARWHAGLNPWEQIRAEVVRQRQLGILPEGCERKLRGFIDHLLVGDYGHVAAEPAPADPPTPPTCLACSFPDPLGEIGRPSREQAHAAFLEALEIHREPPTDLSGDGIVTTGEGRFEVGLIIGAKLLRTVNPTIPLQIWHRGPLVRAKAQLADDPHTRFIAALTFERKHPARNPGGWGSKTYAVMHSGFRRVLFLDGDAYCVQDPAPLFNWLDGEKSFGCWSSSPCRRREWPSQTVLQGHPWAPVHLNGGEYLIDLSRHWDEISVVRWMDDRGPNFWWREAGGGLRCGDEDTWALTWSMLAWLHPERAAKFGVVDRIRHYIPGGICGDGHGVDRIVHRIRSKLIPNTAPRTAKHFPREAEVMRMFEQFSPRLRQQLEEARIAATPAGRRAARQAALGRPHCHKRRR